MCLSLMFKFYGYGNSGPKCGTQPVGLIPNNSMWAIKAVQPAVKFSVITKGFCDIHVLYLLFWLMVCKKALTGTGLIEFIKLPSAQPLT